MGLSLWQINDKIEQIISEGVDQATGEISEEALAELEAMELTKAEKAINWGLYIKGERAEGEAVKAQAQKLMDRAKSHASRAESLRAKLERLLEEGEKFSDDRVQVKWRKSSAVVVDSFDLVPLEYQRQKPAPPPEADKTLLRGALKAGDIPGARLEHRQKLVIE